MIAKKLLIVDDDQDDRELIKTVISECIESTEVTELSDGAIVLDYLNSCPKQNLPDIILLDLNMPRMNGIDVLKEIKNSGKYSIIPVYLLTTSSSLSDKDKAIRSGARDALTKPPVYEEWVKKLCPLIDAA